LKLADHDGLARVLHVVLGIAPPPCDDSPYGQPPLFYVFFILLSLVITTSNALALLPPAKLDQNIQLAVRREMKR
jgi:hypothetical protein